jgi:GntR family transcriptional regulator
VTKINLDLKSKVPIYIQIRDQIRLLIATGEWKEGSQMPPVRDLAATLLINPNTVTKAYHELEREGYIFTRRGMGTFVSDKAELKSVDVNDTAATEIARDFVTRLLELGMSAGQIKALVDETLDSK